MTPFRPFEILIGKSVPALIIGLAEGTVIIAVAVFWFGVPLRGDLGCYLPACSSISSP